MSPHNDERRPTQGGVQVEETDTTVTRATDVERAQRILDRLRGPLPPRPLRPRFSWPRDRADHVQPISEPIDWAEMTGQFVATAHGVTFMSLAHSRRWAA